MSGPGLCLCCRKAKLDSPAVIVVVVWTATLQRGYPIIPAEDYSLCLRDECDSVPLFVSRCAEGHAATKNEGTWLKARLVFQDGRSLMLELKNHLAPARA